MTELRFRPDSVDSVTDFGGVSGEEMRRALTLAEALIGHAMAAFDLAAADPVLGSAHAVIAWIRRARIERLVARDLQRHLRSRFPTVEETATPIRILVEHHYLQQEAPRQTLGPGRPPSDAFLVNPRLHDGRPSVTRQNV